MYLQEKEHKLAGMTLHTVETDKYKTNTIVIKFKAPLQEEFVTQRALLPFVLQSETTKYPSTALLRSYLDELYGATLNVDLSKKGESHIITFKMEIANELYLSDRTPLLLKGIELLSTIIFSPVLEGGAFKTSTVDNEKRSLKQRIQAVYDDKMRYSNLRLVQEMCKNEPYHLHVNGEIEDIEQITSSSLHQYYTKMLAEDEIDMYMIGNFSATDIVSDITRFFSFENREKQTDNQKRSTKKTEKVNEVIEKLDVKQGKLNIGYRTNTTFSDPDYDALQVFNGIFGGFSHSKLFLMFVKKKAWPIMPLQGLKVIKAY